MNNRIQLRPPPPSRDHSGPEQACASLPCLARQVEPRFGYWIRDEELVFLSELLTLKRKVAKACAENGEGADRRVAEVALEMRLLQASLYDFLLEQIKARGGQAIGGSLGKRTFNEVQPNLILLQAIAVASRGQRELVELNQKASLERPAPQLRVAPAAAQKLHHKTIERFKDLLT